MSNGELVLTPGRVASFIGKPEPGGHKVYLTTRDGRSWVELGGRGVAGNPLGMAKQPNRGFPTEEDAWSFVEQLLRDHPMIAEKPRSVFQLYDYDHPAEFYLTRSRPVRLNGHADKPAESVMLFDTARDVKKYERPNRPNQQAFKIAVLARYGARCSFCRIASEKLLDAAHVIAWSEQGADIPENGLILCKLHHCALDGGLIRIDPETLMLQCAPQSDPADLHVEVADIRHLPARPHRDALLWLWERTGA